MVMKSASFELDVSSRLGTRRFQLTSHGYRTVEIGWVDDHPKRRLPEPEYVGCMANVRVVFFVANSRQGEPELTETMDFFFYYLFFFIHRRMGKKKTKA